MAKRTKFQADLLLRAQPPNAFDVLREAADRLENTQCFPPGVIAAVGMVLKGVIEEVDQVKAIKADEKTRQPLAVEGA